MSMDYLTEGEQYYFHKSPDYRRAVLDWLKERGLVLRLASVDMEVAHSSVYSGIMNKIKAASRSRGHRSVKWRYIKKRR